MSDRLFGKVCKVILNANEEDFDGHYGVLVQDLYAMNDSAAVRYLDGFSHKGMSACLKDGFYEYKPRIDELGDECHGLNMRGCAHEMAENAFGAIMSHRKGRSESFSAAYVLGRQDCVGALAFAIYDEALLESAKLLHVDRKTFVQPELIYVVSVCRSEGSTSDRALAQCALESLSNWCTERGLVYYDELLDC